MAPRGGVARLHVDARALYRKRIKVLLSLLKILSVALLLAYLGLGLMALVLTPRMLYPIPPPGYTSAADAVWLHLPDGTRIATVSYPTPEASCLVLYHHGNAEDLGHLQPRLAALQAHGYAVFAYDYPGYGRSSGKPSERSILAAAEAAYAHVTGTLGWAPEQVIHYGHSLGGGPAFALGERHPSAGIIVEGTFTSVFRVLTKRRLLPWDHFDNLARAPRLQAPLLVLHGRLDRTVPFWHGEALAAAAPGARHLWVDDAHHVNLWDKADETLWKTFADFTNRPPSK